MSASLFLARLHVERDAIRTAHPLTSDEMSVYPTASPELRAVLPRREGPEFSTDTQAAVAGILSRDREPRLRT